MSVLYRYRNNPRELVIMNHPSAVAFTTGWVDREVLSARPHAPVVPYVESPGRLLRLRLVLSDRLRRLAAAVEPAAVPVGRSPAC